MSQEVIAYIIIGIAIVAAVLYIIKQVSNVVNKKSVCDCCADKKSCSRPEKR